MPITDVVSQTNESDVPISDILCGMKNNELDYTQTHKKGLTACLKLIDLSQFQKL